MIESSGLKNSCLSFPPFSSIAAALLKLLDSLPVTPQLLIDWSTYFEAIDFQLGDEIANITVSDFASNSVIKPFLESDFYLVCEGRVRLLAQKADRQQDVSVQVLEIGETFGSDRAFYDEGLPYQAIAASQGKLARITFSQLQPLLDQFPTLQERLAQTVQQRQRLIFFKTQTELRSQPPQQQRLLWAHLIPSIVETCIPAGTSLADWGNQSNTEPSPSQNFHQSIDRVSKFQVNTPSTSRFWLRRGQIQGQNQLQIGDSWGYPDSIPTDWIAETDLWVYQINSEQWENVNSLKTHPSTLSASTVLKKHQGGLTPIDPPAKPPDKAAVFDVLSADSQPKEIAFPKPTRRWLWRTQYPFIQQQSAADCGATCLAMVCQYWGTQYNLNFLRELTDVNRTGASLKGLTKAAEHLGFQVRPVRASLGPMRNQNPWIAHWQGNHYVVVYRFQGNRVLIADPGLGKRWIDTEVFTANWSDYALLLDPTPRLYETQSSQPQGIRAQNFFSLIWPYRAAIGQILIASLLIQIFGLLVPLFTQVILDRVVVSKSLVSLHVFALGLLLFSIWRLALTATRQYLLDYLSNRLDLTLISGFINHTLSLPLKFFESRHVGDIITRVQENQKIQRFLTRQAITAWLDTLMAIVYIALMAYYNWSLTLLVVSLIPLIVTLTLVATPLMRKVSREIFQESAQQNSSLVEMITGVATVKAMAAEREMRWRWEDRLTSMVNAQFRGQKLANTLQTTGNLIHSIGSTGLLWFGAWLVIQDRLTIGQFVAFNMMIGNVINPMLSVVQLWDEFQEVVVSVERLDDVFSAQPEETIQKPLLVLPRIKGFVKFDNVSFRYSQEQERNTLQNISFDAAAGDTIAIVGRSGSGKSTLVKLLQSFYYPESGRITIDGHDIRHISPVSLRSQLGVVPQECFLFSGTILENITLYKMENEDSTGDLSPSYLEQAIEVAKLAEAHTFIQEMPLGYQTPVGERGSTLSGGQRQRIAIARALLGNPRILILDEATSSLDTESERRFQQNIAQIGRDRTVFIIAHRLSTVRNADKILVLDRGLLVEQGTHAQLISQQGLYYHLAQQQLEL